jgi:hypothetical protein
MVDGGSSRSIIGWKEMKIPESRGCGSSGHKGSGGSNERVLLSGNGHCSM